MKKTYTNKKGFTLIELLTVIAILGILVTLGFGGIQAGWKVIREFQVKAAMTDIGRGYTTYANSGSSTKNITRIILRNETDLKDTPAGFAEYLAKRDAVLDPELWFISSDPSVDRYKESKAWPKTIGEKDSSGRFKRNADWTKDLPIAYAIALGTTTKAPERDQQPLLWTRDLRETGTWGDKNPMGAAGAKGFILLKNGMVKAFQEITVSEGLMMKGGQTTSNIYDLVDKNDVIEYNPPTM